MNWATVIGVAEIVVIPSTALLVFLLKVIENSKAIGRMETKLDENSKAIGRENHAVPA